MSRPSKSPKKKKKTKRQREAEEAVELPDDQAIRKLFPKKVVDYLNKEIDHKPKS